MATSAYIECANGEIILLDAGVENIATIFDDQKVHTVFLTHFHPKDDKGFADLFKHKKAINYVENTTGYLIQSLDKTIAYLTDCAGISEESMKFLKSHTIDTCYIDASLAPNFSNGNT